MMKLVSIAVISLISLLIYSTDPITELLETSVIDILEENGADFSEKRPDFSDPNVSAERGKEMFFEGTTRDARGRKIRKLSKHFECIACHNIEREDPDLSVSDPEARLDYTAKKGLPFLPGTTMFGAVNRSTYYNGDYYYKYGDLVTDARHSLRKSIQLCATECAQGRPLKDWELESMLAYLWELQLTLGDLDISDMELKNITDRDISQDSIKKLLASKYLSGSPASFIPPPADRKTGTGLAGDAEKGGLIYRNSCLHCHQDGRYSYMYLDDKSISKKHLARHAPTYSPHSIYQVIRWGVGSHYGKESYMPQYTAERLSDQQLADLLAYLKE